MNSKLDPFDMMSMITDESGSLTGLKARIKLAASMSGLPMKDLTVLSVSRDPYRLDTAANHTVGQWFADGYAKVHDGGRIHLRGLHYKFIGQVIKPDGNPYINDDDTWLWFSEKAAKAARYLGYVPWDAIRDARNSPPQIFTPDNEKPEWHLLTGEVELYLPDDFDPRYEIYGKLYRQPWRQIIIAEKQGVEELLLPVCKKYQATLCLPGGEISDTLVYDMLRDAYKDGRPLAIHQLGDFDPSGWQMAVSTARKVQALVDTQFPGLRVVVHSPALTLKQCREWNLPSTPLKATEKRGTDWKKAQGWEQTELDAAVALAPVQFVKAIEDSLLQYYDTGVAGRAREKRIELEEEANENLCIGDDEIRAEAQNRLDELQELVDEVNKSMYVAPEAVGLEPPEELEVIIGDARQPDNALIDTEGDWSEQSLNLIARKHYE